MARSIEPIGADLVRPLGEPAAVQPELMRPLPGPAMPGPAMPSSAMPGSAWSGSAWPGAASLSRGAIVEASILARLLGIPLLRLDAHIDMVPSDAGNVLGSPMIELAALAPAPFTPADPTGTLADAAELLQHASQTLGEVRRERLAGR